ncbi:MAG: PepSY-associated TM helix domain-containing protein [Phycisphaeraceae bacterium]
MLGLSTKQLFRLHGWLGMNLGLMLFVVCFSGTVATLSHELDWLANPAMRVSPPSDAQPASWGAIHQAVREAHPDWTIRWLDKPMGRYAAAEAVVTTDDRQWRWVYINPYTAQVQGDTSYFNVQRFLRSFHRRLFIGDLPWLPDSLYITCFFGFILLFSAVTGLLFYKNWWRYLFRLRLGKSARVLWSDVHRMIGVWTLLFAVLIALTGIWYFVEEGMGDLDVAPKGTPLPRMSNEELDTYGEDAEHLPLDRLVAAAEQAHPALEVKRLWLPTGRRTVLRVWGQGETWLVRNRANHVAVNPYTAEVMRVQHGSDLTPLLRWQDTADPLHFGNFAGLTVKLLWFVLGLVLSLSILVGAYLWRLRTLAQGPSHRDGLWNGASFILTVALLGLAACRTYEGIMGYGPPPRGETAPEVPWGVTLFVGGFVVVTIVTIVAWFYLIVGRKRPRPAPPRAVKPEPTAVSRTGLKRLDREPLEQPV